MLENVFTQNLSGVEAYSAIYSTRSIPEIIKLAVSTASPPLFYIAEHFAFQFFGVNENVIRGLSLLFYLLTALFVYKIGSLVWSRKTGLFSATLTLLNPLLFAYAFEGSVFSMLAFTVTASMYFFIKAFVEKQGGLGTRIGYILITLLALYTHPFSLFILPAQGVWYLREIAVRNTQTAGKMLKAFFIIGILYLPWVIPLINQARAVNGALPPQTPAMPDLLKLVYEFLATGIKHQLAEPALYIVLILLLVRDWTKKIGISLLLLFWFLLPIAAAWLLSQKFPPVFMSHYLLFTIPGAMLILATNKRVPASTIIIAVLAVLFAIINYNFFTSPANIPFRELASYINESKDKEDFLINWDDAGNNFFWETKYYNIDAPLYLPGENDRSHFPGNALMEDTDIISIIPEIVERVGVITSSPVEQVQFPDYTVEKHKEFGELKFIWLLKENKD